MIPAAEPRITVGLVEQAARIDFELQGRFQLAGRILPEGAYTASLRAGAAALADARGAGLAAAPVLALTPADDAACFMVRNIAIGRAFHWQRLQHHRFRGELLLDACGGSGLAAINRIGLEAYLSSVICSEMSPASDAEFLKAHCVISRSWLLAQLELKRTAGDAAPADGRAWTDAAAHRHFDVCNDDHCQRYHGIGRVNAAARQALADTRGQVLTCGGAVCDARFAKCCGGITERFSACWQDVDFAYLQPVADCPAGLATFSPPADSEAAARRFILASPDAFCNVTDRDLLARVLPDFDFETKGFFRWSVRLGQRELQELLARKTGTDFGAIRRLTPLARGASGRIIRLKISGTKAEQVIEKELAVRRALSPSHLYSSAFVVEEETATGGAPEAFVLRGAGWGHGVGLCQIGAAAMAARGCGYGDILSHYFRGAGLKTIYP